MVLLVRLKLTTKWLRASYSVLGLWNLDSKTFMLFRNLNLTSLLPSWTWLSPLPPCGFVKERVHFYAGQIQMVGPAHWHKSDSVPQRDSQIWQGCQIVRIESRVRFKWEVRFAASVRIKLQGPDLTRLPDSYGKCPIHSACPIQNVPSQIQ